MFASAVLIPFLWSHVLNGGGSGDATLEANRTLLGLPPTWKELQEETLAVFEVGIPPTILPKFVLESARGFEMAFFDDGCFYGLQYFLERTGNEEVTTMDWSVPLARTTRKRLGTSAERSLSYLHPTSHPMAPPMARAVKEQRFERFNDKAVLLQTFTTTHDVPMADCFVVEERLLVETIKGNQLQVSGYFRIQFVQSTMFRSVIQQQTTAEFREYFEHYKGFLLAIAEGRQSVWQPNQNSGGDSQFSVAAHSHGSRRPLPIKILSTVTRPFRPLLRQVGKLARMINGWKRRLGEKNRHGKGGQAA